MEEFQVRDGERVITFAGVELASVTSRERTKQRWIELRLFKTQAGSYVLSGCGRTLKQGEVDRHWAQVSDAPEGILERLHLYNDVGERYIPTTSRRLLREAGERDAAIMQAYMVERVA